MSEASASLVVVLSMVMVERYVPTVSSGLPQNVVVTRRMPPTIAPPAGTADRHETVCPTTLPHADLPPGAPLTATDGLAKLPRMAPQEHPADRSTDWMAPTIAVHVGISEDTPAPVPAGHSREPSGAPPNLIGRLSRKHTVKRSGSARFSSVAAVTGTVIAYAARQDTNPKPYTCHAVAESNGEAFQIKLMADS